MDSGLQDFDVTGSQVGHRIPALRTSEVKKVNIKMVFLKDGAERETVGAIGAVTVANHDHRRAPQAAQQPSLVLTPVRNGE